MSVPETPRTLQSRALAQRLAKEALARWVCDGHLNLAKAANQALVLFETNSIRDYGDDFPDGDTFLVTDKEAPDGYFLCAREWCACDPGNELPICQHSLTACLFLGYRSHQARIYQETGAAEQVATSSPTTPTEEPHPPLKKGCVNDLTCPNCVAITSLEVSANTEALSYMIECPSCGDEFEVELYNQAPSEPPSNPLPVPPTEEPASPTGKGTFPVYTPAPKEDLNQCPPANPFKGVTLWRWQGGRLPKPRKIRDDQNELGEHCAAAHDFNHCLAQLADSEPVCSLVEFQN